MYALYYLKKGVFGARHGIDIFILESNHTPSKLLRPQNSSKPVVDRNQYHSAFLPAKQHDEDPITSTPSENTTTIHNPDSKTCAEKFTFSQEGAEEDHVLPTSSKCVVEPPQTLTPLDNKPIISIKEEHVELSIISSSLPSTDFADGGAASTSSDDACVRSGTCDDDGNSSFQVPDNNYQHVGFATMNSDGLEALPTFSKTLSDSSRDGNNQFSDTKDLNSRKRSKSKDKPHACDECGKYFSFKKSLKRHMLIHTGEKPYTCDVCNKKFRDKKDLNVHYRIHTNEKPFACTICSRTFSQSGNLHKHMLLHNGERRFQCSICEKPFYRKDEVQRHEKTHKKVKKMKSEAVVAFIK